MSAVKRLVLGTFGKWLLVVVVLAVALVALKLPALPLLAGAVNATQADCTAWFN